jgi:hypothetical protein
VHAIHNPLTGNGAAIKSIFARSRARRGFSQDLLAGRNARNNAQLCTATVKIAQIPRLAEERAFMPILALRTEPIVYPPFIVGGHDFRECGKSPMRGDDWEGLDS